MSTPRGGREGIRRACCPASLQAANRLDVGHSAEAARALRDLLDQWAPGTEPRDQVLYARLHLIAGDIRATHDLAVDLERVCRDQGALAVLPQVQVLLARAQLFLGRHREAGAAVTDGLRIAAETCHTQARSELSVIAAELAAIRGDEDACGALVAEPLELDVAPASVHASGALSLLDLGLGRYEEALVRLEAVVAGSRPMGLVASLPVLVEAASRLGRPERAAVPAARFAAWADGIGRPWARALALRCRALLEGSEDAYRRALELGGCPFDHARTRLLYGEWLRRERRAGEARDQLHVALEDMLRLGADPWAARARAELRATGGSRVADTLARERSEDLLDRLTPQEFQVVRLAATGLTNRGIGARLFLSPRTVGHHLYKAYPKLGVASRSELGAPGLHRAVQAGSPTPH